MPNQALSLTDPACGRATVHWEEEEADSKAPASAPQLNATLATRNGEDIMLPVEQKRAYTAFYNSARHNAHLDERTTILIHFSTALALACYP